MKVHSFQNEKLSAKLSQWNYILSSWNQFSCVCHKTIQIEFSICLLIM